MSAPKITDLGNPTWDDPNEPVTIPRAPMIAVTAYSAKAAQVASEKRSQTVHHRSIANFKDDLVLYCTRCEMEKVVPLSNYTGSETHHVIECFEHMASVIRSLRSDVDQVQTDLTTVERRF